MLKILNFVKDMLLERGSLKNTHFLNKQLDFGPALKSCLTYLVFQHSQNDWYPLKHLILALFWLFDVKEKFARM